MVPSLDLSGARRRWAGRAGCDRPHHCAARAEFIASSERRDGRWSVHFRDDDLAPVCQVHRSRARGVLRHGSDRRRGRRQDDHVSLHPSNSTRFRADWEIPRVSGVHGPADSPDGDDCLLPHRAARWWVGRASVPVAPDRPGHDCPRALRPTARCSRSWAPGSSGRW